MRPLLALGALLALAGPVTAQSSDPTGASVEVTHRGPGQASRVEFRLEPPSAARDELYVWMSNRDGGERFNRARTLTRDPDGAYRLEYAFPASGTWGFYLRSGVGQAGVTAWTSAYLEPKAGVVDRFSASFRGNDYRDGVPAYVQPVGYAVFGLVAAGALGGVALILRSLARRPRGPTAA